ncbi:MAG: hypothetical protein JSS82_03955 [Bacteroidetes bacterium]|nr:hypothetical protein [Bacteroidota bacterium]
MHVNTESSSENDSDSEAEQTTWSEAAPETLYSTGKRKKPAVEIAPKRTQSGVSNTSNSISEPIKVADVDSMPIFSQSTTESLSTKKMAKDGTEGISVSDDSGTSSTSKTYLTPSMIQNMEAVMKSLGTRLREIDSHPVTIFGKRVASFLSQSDDPSKVFKNYTTHWTKPMKLMTEGNRETLAIALDALNKSYMTSSSVSGEGSLVLGEPIIPADIKRTLSSDVIDLLNEYSYILINHALESLEIQQMRQMYQFHNSVIFTGQLELQDSVSTAASLSMIDIRKSVPHLSNATTLNHFIEDDDVRTQFARVVARTIEINVSAAATRPQLDKHQDRLRGDRNAALAWFYQCIVSGRKIIHTDFVRTPKEEQYYAARNYLGLDGYMKKQNTPIMAMSHVYSIYPSSLTIITD